MLSIPSAFISISQFGTNVSKNGQFREPVRDSYGKGYSVQTLPTDPVGSAIVTFQGVLANSEIRVYYPDGTEAAGIENCSANQALNWNVYPAGSDNNTVTIRIVALASKIKVFNYTASAGPQSIPVQQEPDKWFSNP